MKMFNEEMNEVCRFLIVQNPNANLPAKYATLMREFDALSAD